MRISVALPIVAALAASAIGLSSITPAQARNTLAGCKASYNSCIRYCARYTDAEFKRGCTSRCNVAVSACVKTADIGSKAGGAKPGGGAWSGSTAGGQPFPKGPAPGGSTGTTGGGPPAPKGPVIGKPTGANGGGLPPVAKYSKR